MLTYKRITQQPVLFNHLIDMSPILLGSNLLDVKGGELSKKNSLRKI